MNQNRFKIITLGCKVNQSESAALAQQLREAGAAAASDAGEVTLCVVNTCTVTGKAAAQSRQAVRRAARQYPGAKIVATGCDARIEPHAFGDIAGVTVVDGGGKQQGPDDMLKQCGIHGHDPQTDPGDVLPPAPDKALLSPRTRPFLKVQDGCNANCTYCIVPRARGRSRSVPLERVLNRLAAFETAGFREVVLTGIHLGAYGRELDPAITLADLLERSLTAGNGPRLRLSSIEPAEVTGEIIALVAGSDRLCRHFHIPLQSGDDEILRRMRRPYDRAAFGRVIRSVARQIPDAAIGVDVLVGFPGESEAAFANTYDLIESLPVTYLHVFPFSPRPGTPAAHFPGQVPVKALKERGARMRRLGKVKRHEFHRRFINQPIEVLVEGTRDRVSGKLKGVSDNYLSVHFDGADDFMNRIVEVRTERLHEDGYLEGHL